MIGQQPFQTDFHQVGLVDLHKPRLDFHLLGNHVQLGQDLLEHRQVLRRVSDNHLADRRVVGDRGTRGEPDAHLREIGLQIRRQSRSQFLLSDALHLASAKLLLRRRHLLPRLPDTFDERRLHGIHPDLDIGRVVVRRHNHNDVAIDAVLEPGHLRDDLQRLQERNITGREGDFIGLASARPASGRLRRAEQIFVGSSGRLGRGGPARGIQMEDDVDSPLGGICRSLVAFHRRLVQEFHHVMNVRLAEFDLRDDDLVHLVQKGNRLGLLRLLCRFGLRLDHLVLGIPGIAHLRGHLGHRGLALGRVHGVLAIPQFLQVAHGFAIVRIHRQDGLEAAAGLFVVPLRHGLLAGVHLLLDFRFDFVVGLLDLFLPPGHSHVLFDPGDKFGERTVIGILSQQFLAAGQRRGILAIPHERQDRLVFALGNAGCHPCAQAFRRRSLGQLAVGIAVMQQGLFEIVVFPRPFGGIHALAAFQFPGLPPDFLLLGQDLGHFGAIGGRGLFRCHRRLFRDRCRSDGSLHLGLGRRFRLRRLSRGSGLGLNQLVNRQHSRRRGRRGCLGRSRRRQLLDHQGIGGLSHNRRHSRFSFHGFCLRRNGFLRHNVGSGRRLHLLHQFLDNRILRDHSGSQQHREHDTKTTQHDLDFVHSHSPGKHNQPCGTDVAYSPCFRLES